MIIVVRLDRLTMQGFKSFANRVTIPFPAGFNCIAGPNGSGKSNIVDAITFVLGTSSARSIRAQKLQNLLFGGNKSRKAADYCEVTLYLDNTDKQLPGESELKITRRVTRSGMTVYKLDGRTVTRSKIIDLLANAKMSPDGYNIIMQGDVTRIIEMSPSERRSVIDEISGIAEFDEKREKAGHELERVESLVRESMIVVAEKQRLVSRLKTEKETAEKYQRLNDSLRKTRASLLKKRIAEDEEKEASISKEIEESSKKFGELEKSFFDAENRLERIEKSVKKKNDEIIQKSKNYDVLRSIDKTQTDILRKHDRIDSNEREMARLKSMAPVAGHVVKEVLNLKMDGIHGTVSSLVDAPSKYSVALEVAMGRHGNDVVVENDDVAAGCIKYLKERKIGRARFIPLNKIRSRGRKHCDAKIIGYAIDLIKFDSRFSPAIEFVLGSTIVVDNIDTARKIRGFRIVTLDGDLIEISGVMIGGYYRKSLTATNDTQKLEAENVLLNQEITDLEEELEKLKSLQQTESEDVTNLQTEKAEEEKEIEEFRALRKQLFEGRLVLQNELSKMKIEKARIDAVMDGLKMEFEEFKDVTEFLDRSVQELQENVRKCIIEINSLGPVNMRAIEEYNTINVEFEEMKKKLDKMLEEKAAVMRISHEVEKKRYDKFMETLNKISENFSNIYRDLMNGTGRLRLEIENNIDSGLVIEASPDVKNIVNLDTMSGGEKTLTSLAFLFGIMQMYSSPFYILDEVDAALDKANTRKIVDVVKKYSKINQFIVITHNDFTIQEADKVFGVSMEDGVSKVFGIELPKE